MKHFRFFMILIFLTACAPGSENDTPVGVLDRDVQPQQLPTPYSVAKSITTLQTNSEKIEITEYKPTFEVRIDKQQMKLLGKIEVFSQEETSNEFYRYFYLSDINMVGFLDDSPSNQKTMDLMESLASTEHTVTAKELDFNELRNTLNKQNDFNLYRCKDTDLNKKLSRVHLGFKGDWTFAVPQSSYIRQHSPFQLALSFDRRKRNYIGASFIMTDFELVVESGENRPLTFYANIPSRIFASKDTKPPVSGRPEAYRQACDEFYERHFRTENSGTGLVALHRLNYLPEVDEDLEQKISEEGSERGNLPLALIDPYETEKLGMLESDRIEYWVLNEVFFDQERFPDIKIQTPIISGFNN